VTRRPRRRRLLIDALQYRLLGITLLHVGVVVTVFVLVLFVPLILQLKSHTRSYAEKQDAAAQFLFLHTHLWPALVLVFVLLVLHSVVVSHRIAGPLYRFRRVLEAVAGGDLSVRATIRKHDYLWKEAAAIDATIVALGTRIQAVDEQAKALRAAFAELGSAVDGGSTVALDRSVRLLDARLATLQERVGQFRLPSEESHRRGGMADTAVAAGPPAELPTTSRPEI
jgi:methyl-accepting chemotaxis protein